jgi:hypothetical protein
MVELQTISASLIANPQYANFTPGFGGNQNRQVGKTTKNLTNAPDHFTPEAFMVLYRTLGIISTPQL